MQYNKIKEIRKEKNIKLKELSALTGLSIGYISLLENGGRQNPSYKSIEKISKALDIDVSIIFDL